VSRIIKRPRVTDATKWVRKTRHRSSYSFSLEELELMSNALESYAYWDLCGMWPNAKRNGEVILEGIEDVEERFECKKVLALSERLMQRAHRAKEKSDE